MPLRLHRSNRAEALVDALAEVVSRPSAAPLQPECIAVQGPGMERWLGMQLARRLGVWANPDFPFPRALLDRLFDAVLGPPAEPERPFSPQALTWSLLALLPQLIEREELAPLRAYLEDDADAVKRVQLASRIAETFDRYAVYRPDMVLAWERGEGESGDWQPIVWRALVEAHGATHVAARARHFLEALQTRGIDVRALPARIQLFGLATLPPLYLRLLAALSEHVETHLFLVTPTQQYWADVRSAREIGRQLHDPNADVDALHLTEGHPLLGSLGKLGRDFQQLLEELVAYDEDDVDCFHDPGEDTLLHLLQSDMLSLRSREAGGDAPPGVARADDDSIELHSCHGPMREVEVLYDRLQALFDADPTLHPRDIVVMAPDIGIYAPLVEAVFGSESSGIPYRVADRRTGTSEAYAHAFGRLLEVCRGRLGATEVLDLLSLDPLRRRFELSHDELDTVRRWLAESGIRWGENAAHREEVGQPATHTHTWRFGLERLLLGYAMPGADRRMFGGALPFDDIEGAEAQLLGRFLDFCERLFALREQTSRPRTPAAWAPLLLHAMDDLLQADEDETEQAQRLRQSLDTLFRAAARAGCEAPLSLAAVESLLAVGARLPTPGRGFLSGSVTFCELVPMRSIPFRVVCLLGMDDDALPRSEQAPSFDLIAQRPRLGDRNRRDEDRYLFLEALLSARERFLVFYAGQSIRDNTRLPPSVLVGELLDTLQRSVRDQERAGPDPAPTSLERRLVVEHPLQPFSPRYFGGDPDPRLFSYSASYARGAAALLRARIRARPFLTARGASAPALPDALGIEQLARFLSDPVRGFAQQCLGLYLDRDADRLEDREPSHLDGLQTWALGHRLVREHLEGDATGDVHERLQAGGWLPAGTPGRCLLDDLWPEAQRLADAARPHMQGERLPALHIARALGGIELHGSLHDLWPAARLEMRFARSHERAELQMWIRHLLLCWAGDGHAPCRSALILRGPRGGPARQVCFEPVSDPEPLLRDLLDLYIAGMQAPLPVFAKASRTYVEGLQGARDHKAERAARNAARRLLDGNAFKGGELDEAYAAQLFDAGRHPLDADLQPSFADVATRMLQPMLDHRKQA